MKNIKQSILSIAIGLALVAGISWGAWTEPSANPPGDNVAAPINVSLNTQTFGNSSSAGQNKTLSMGNGTGILSILGGVKINGVIQITGGVPGEGKILTSDISGIASWKSPAETPHGSQLFTTVGANTFTVHPGVTKVFVSMIAGGGGGGSGNLNSTPRGGGGGGGGGGGAIKNYPIDIIPGITKIDVFVGGGGNNGSDGPGSEGGNSFFGTVIAYGGSGGGAGYAGGGGAGGGGGRYNTTQSYGSDGVIGGAGDSGSGCNAGGDGGPSTGINGGGKGDGSLCNGNHDSGDSGHLYGGAGGGGQGGKDAATTGGTGANGYVSVLW